MEGKHDIIIEHPEKWELLLSIEEKQLNYILFSTSVANSLIIGEVSLNDNSLQTLEDTIYDTSVLLNEYKRVRIVVHSNRFVMLPMETGDDDCEAMVRHAFPSDDGDAAVCALPGNGVKTAFLMPRGLSAFLGRTFNYPAVCHHLLPLCEYFQDLNHGDSISRMFLHLRPDVMDLAIYRDGRLMCANSYPFSSAEDAAYFAMNAWRTSGLDQLTDELHLMGDNSTRAMMTPVLREYVKYVMPAVYPAAAMQLGRNAMQAPLELILLALCE